MAKSTHSDIWPRQTQKLKRSQARKVQQNAFLVGRRTYKFMKILQLRRNIYSNDFRLLIKSFSK